MNYQYVVANTSLRSALFYSREYQVPTSRQRGLRVSRSSLFRANPKVLSRPPRGTCRPIDAGIFPSEIPVIPGTREIRRGPSADRLEPGGELQERPPP